ncbi:hypothetical protein PGO08_25140, partial [Klebsiella aerogenes]
KAGDVFRPQFQDLLFQLAGAAQSELLRRQASRLMLHASELHFHHPVSGKAIAARQPSPF